MKFPLNVAMEFYDKQIATLAWDMKFKDVVELNRNTLQNKMLRYQCKITRTWPSPT